MKKRTLIIVCILLLMLLFLLPIPIRLKDGGSVVYTALLYQVQDVKRLAPVESGKGFEDGLIVKILGIEIFNNVD